MTLLFLINACAGTLILLLFAEGKFKNKLKSQIASNTKSISRLQYTLASIGIVGVALAALEIFLTEKVAILYGFSFFLVIPTILFVGFPYFLGVKQIFVQKEVMRLVLLSAILFTAAVVIDGIYSNWCARVTACIPI